MNIRDIIDKYTGLYRDYGRRGLRNKLFSLVLIIPASLFIYLQLEYQWNIPNYKEITHENVIEIIVIITIVCALIILTTKSINFHTVKQVKSLKANFKRDLFSLIKQEIPEITQYIFYQKIHPETIKKSGLIRLDYTDYLGDDWLRGKYKNVNFEICELHLFKPLKSIFDGMFVRCYYDNDDLFRKSGQLILTTEIQDQMHIFESKHKASVQWSFNNPNLFLTFQIKEKFFEITDEGSIQKLERDYAMLKDLILITKEMIAYFHSH
jgi:hypothetical protein